METDDVSDLQEMEIAVQANERQSTELQRRQAADRKQSSKQLKKDWRNRRQAFGDQLELRRAGIVNEHECIRLRQVMTLWFFCPQYGGLAAELLGGYWRVRVTPGSTKGAAKDIGLYAVIIYNRA